MRDMMLIRMSVMWRSAVGDRATGGSRSRWFRGATRYLSRALCLTSVSITGDTCRLFLTLCGLSCLQRQGRLRTGSCHRCHHLVHDLRLHLRLRRRPVFTQIHLIRHGTSPRPPRDLVGELHPELLSRRLPVTIKLRRQGDRTAHGPEDCGRPRERCGSDREIMIDECPSVT
jgi:hypothetical protein